MESKQNKENPSQTILVADDSKHARSICQALLASKGYDLILVENGEEAISKIEEVKPDFALIDINMPGMTGYEVAAKCKARNESLETVFVALTGNEGQQWEQRSFSSGFEFHLTKPLDHQRLEKIISHESMV